MDTVTTEIIETSNTAESPIKKFHKNLSNKLDNTNMYYFFLLNFHDTIYMVALLLTFKVKC